MAKVVPPICMAFYKGVSSDATAYPLNATDISQIIGVRTASAATLATVAHESVCFAINPICSSIFSLPVLPDQSYLLFHLFIVGASKDSF